MLCLLNLAIYTESEGWSDLSNTISLECDAGLAPATVAQRIPEVAHRNIFGDRRRAHDVAGSAALCVARKVEFGSLSSLGGET